MKTSVIESINYYKNNGGADTQNIEHIREVYAELGYEMEEALSGHYRLVYNSEADGLSHFVAEDSANEDCYDEELAAITFYGSALEHFLRGKKLIEVNDEEKEVSNLEYYLMDKTGVELIEEIF